MTLMMVILPYVRATDATFCSEPRKAGLTTVEPGANRGFASARPAGATRRAAARPGSGRDSGPPNRRYIRRPA